MRRAIYCLERNLAAMKVADADFLNELRESLDDTPGVKRHLRTLEFVLQSHNEIARVLGDLYIEAATALHPEAMIRGQVLAKAGEPRATPQFVVEGDSPIARAFARYLARLPWKRGLPNELIELAVQQFADEYAAKLRLKLKKAIVKFDRK